MHVGMRAVLAVAVLYGLAHAGAARSARADPPRTLQSSRGSAEAWFKDYRDTLWYRQWRSPAPTPVRPSFGASLRYGSGRTRVRTARRRGGALWSPLIPTRRSTRCVHGCVGYRGSPHVCGACRRCAPTLVLPEGRTTVKYLMIRPGGLEFYYIRVK